MAHYSWFSPDRSWVLVVEINGVTEWQRCRVVPMEGHAAGVQVRPQGAYTAAGRTRMYLDVAVDGSSHLWRKQRRVRASQGFPEQINFGPTDKGPGRGAGREIASLGVRQSSVWTHEPQGIMRFRWVGRRVRPGF